MFNHSNTFSLSLARRSLSFLSQSIKIVAAFFQKALADEAFDHVEDGGARFGVVAARLEEFVQIERFLAPIAEHFQNSIG